MGKLAIKGHPKRGKEVIQILEMLRGKDELHIKDACNDCLYTILEGRDNGNLIIGTSPNERFVVFTLEQFLDRYPHKVGDKVLVRGELKTIVKAEWNDSLNEVVYGLKANILSNMEYVVLGL